MRRMKKLEDSNVKSKKVVWVKIINGRSGIQLFCETIEPEIEDGYCHKKRINSLYSTPNIKEGYFYLSSVRKVCGGTGGLKSSILATIISEQSLRQEETLKKLSNIKKYKKELAAIKKSCDTGEFLAVLMK